MDWISKKSSCDLKNWRYIINIKYPYFAWAWVMNVCFFMGQDHQQSNLQAHNGSKWLKTARNRVTLVCLMWFLATFSISVSVKWMSFAFKMQAYISQRLLNLNLLLRSLCISMSSQFYEFLKSDGFLLLGPAVWRSLSIPRTCIFKGTKARPG